MWGVPYFEKQPSIGCCFNKLAESLISRIVPCYRSKKCKKCSSMRSLRQEYGLLPGTIQLSVGLLVCQPTLRTDEQSKQLLYNQQISWQQHMVLTKPVLSIKFPMSLSIQLSIEIISQAIGHAEHQCHQSHRPTPGAFPSTKPEPLHGWKDWRRKHTEFDC